MTIAAPESPFRGGNHSRETSAGAVIVYLHAFYEMNAARWPNLKTMLETDLRLQLGG